MNKICLLALFIAVASARLAADMGNIPPSRQSLTCLAAKNVTKVIFEISDQKGIIQKDFFDGYIFARDAGISTVDAIVVVNDTLTASDLSTEVTSALPADFNRTIWLQVLNAPTLWSRQMIQRIPYLEDLILAFKQHGIRVGIYSDAKAWTSIIGYQTIGSDILDSAPVWYVNTNNVSNFDDFSYAGFGTWAQPNLKNFQKNVPLCYTLIASLDYYEAKWKLNAKIIKS